MGVGNIALPISSLLYNYCRITEDEYTDLMLVSSLLAGVQQIRLYMISYQYFRSSQLYVNPHFEKQIRVLNQTLTIAFAVTGLLVVVTKFLYAILSELFQLIVLGFFGFLFSMVAIATVAFMIVAMHTTRKVITKVQHETESHKKFEPDSKLIAWHIGLITYNQFLFVSSYAVLFLITGDMPIVNLMIEAFKSWSVLFVSAFICWQVITVDKSHFDFRRD